MTTGEVPHQYDRIPNGFIRADVDRQSVVCANGYINPVVTEDDIAVLGVLPEDKSLASRAESDQLPESWYGVSFLFEGEKQLSHLRKAYALSTEVDLKLLTGRSCSILLSDPKNLYSIVGFVSRPDSEVIYIEEESIATCDTSTTYCTPEDEIDITRLIEQSSLEASFDETEFIIGS